MTKREELRIECARNGIELEEAVNMIFELLDDNIYFESAVDVVIREIRGGKNQHENQQRNIS